MPHIKFCKVAGCSTRIGLETPDGLCDAHAGRDISAHPTFIHDRRDIRDAKGRTQIERMQAQQVEADAQRVRHVCEHCKAPMPETRKVPGERFCSDLCRSLHAYREGPASCARSKRRTAR